MIHQVVNQPRGRHWDIDLILGFCKEAVAYAKERNATVGIDSWGVDHGFLDADGAIASAPVMYRDASHQIGRAHV